MEKDTKLRTLDWLYRHLKEMRLAEANTERQLTGPEYHGPCRECALRDIRLHIHDVEWTIARVLEYDEHKGERVLEWADMPTV